MVKILFIGIFLFFWCDVRCQTTPIIDTTDLSTLSLEDLVKLKSRSISSELEKSVNQAIEVASRKPNSIRQSSSIISVITDDEIEKSGARDLMDLLKLIPGIGFNVDVEGVIGVSFRGMWANEGKVLLQIDGQEMNENAYATLQFGNHYQISQIKKIEIIRGPGSALYGGSAEYAVINIITKKGNEIKGISSNVVIGQTNNVYSRQNVDVAVGNKVNDFTYSLSGLIGRGQRSNLNYTDVYNTTYNMANNANLNPTAVNFNMTYKNLSVVLIYDNYSTTTRDGYDAALSKPYPNDFTSYLAELKYIKKWNKKLQLQTKFNYKQSIPWKFDGQPLTIDSAYGYYKIITNRYRLNINVIWDSHTWLKAVAGAEAYYDFGYKPNGQLFVTDNAARVNYLNYAPYMQLLIKTQVANITLGARYDISDAFGSAFNPRIGIIKKLGPLNFKLLYASSFRAPSIENIQYELDKITLKPEKTNTLEFETSYKINKNMYLTANLFDISTFNAIRYFVKTDTPMIGDPVYCNSNKVIGSQGIELEYQYKTNRGYLKFVYSYYTIANKEVDSANEVSINRATTLGMAQNKFAILGSINLGKYFFISPSVYYTGRRYGYSSVDTLGNGIISLYQPQAQYNLYIGCSNWLNCFSYGIGINNITDEKIVYLQAYNSLHGPLPGLGREFYLKLNYNFKFKNKK